jgi:hypothetical protein
MKKVYKYVLPKAFWDEGVKVTMPRGAELLSCQVQHGEITIWALVDLTEDDVVRTFRVFGTGHDVPDALTFHHYVGTVQFMNGQLVFHVFEVTK